MQPFRRRRPIVLTLMALWASYATLLWCFGLVAVLRGGAQVTPGRPEWTAPLGSAGGVAWLALYGAVATAAVGLWGHRAWVRPLLPLVPVLFGAQAVVGGGADALRPALEALACAVAVGGYAYGWPAARTYFRSLQPGREFEYPAPAI